MIDWIIWGLVLAGSALLLRDWRVFPVFMGFVLIEGYGTQPLDLILDAVGVLLIVLAVDWNKIMEDLKKFKEEITYG